VSFTGQNSDYADVTENAPLSVQPSKPFGREFSQQFAQRWGSENTTVKVAPQSAFAAYEPARTRANPQPGPRERVGPTPESALEDINSLYDRVREICSKRGG
jgi:hypothetical protein